MGGSKTETTTNTTQQATPTAEETELNKLQLERTRAAQPQQLLMDQLGGDLVSKLLAGGDLPGNLAPLGQGTDPTELVNKSLEDIRPGFQGAGIWDSGVRAELEAGTAADIRMASQESDRNRLLNLLNLATGSPAQIQAPQLSVAGQLGQRLAGLRTNTGSGSQINQEGFGSMFNRSFAGALGKTAGSPSFSAGPFGF